MNSLFYKIEGSGIPIILIHGFTGNHKSFEIVSKYLSQYFKVISVDLIGHGNSMIYDESFYNFEKSTKLLTDLIESLNINKVNVLGYSLGGRTALHLGLKYKKNINKLILCSTSYGIEGKENRKSRILSDKKIIDLLTEKTIDDFVEFWESLSIWDSEKKLGVSARKKLRAIRKSQNPLGLSLSLKYQGQGVQSNLINYLDRIVNNTMILYGENDIKYEKISKKMSKAIRNSKTIVVPHSGHNIILENPIFVSRAVKNFILGVKNDN